MKQEKTTNYREIAAFFLPLSLTSLIITLSHSVVNAGVARTPNPETALAAYAIARSLVMLIENPMFMVRQTVVSLVKDVESFMKVSRFLYALSWLITALLAVLGFTSLGLFVLQNIMGASPQIAAEAHLALKALVLLPLFTVSRNIYHGVAIVAKQTLLVPFSTTLRLIVMSSVVFSLALITELPGALSASLSFAGAFLIEAAVMRFKAKPLLSTASFFSPTRKGQPELEYSTISRFFVPLVVTTFVATSFGPLINTGLARSHNPAIALAAYSVGYGLGSLILGPIGMLHQCTLAFTRPGVLASYQITKRFTVAFSLIGSLLLVTVGFSPLGSLLLSNLMGVSRAVEIAALQVLQVMSLLPLLFGWREYLWGILMQQKRTNIIGGAKAINLVVVVTSVLLLLATNLVEPAAAGAWAMVLGELADCLIMQAYYSKTGGPKKRPAPLAGKVL